MYKDKLGYQYTKFYLLKIHDDIFYACMVMTDNSGEQKVRLSKGKMLGKVTVSEKDIWQSMPPAQISNFRAFENSTIHFKPKDNIEMIAGLVQEEINNLRRSMVE